MSDPNLGWRRKSWEIRILEVCGQWLQPELNTHVTATRTLELNGHPAMSSSPCDGGNVLSLLSNIVATKHM